MPTILLTSTVRRAKECKGKFDSLENRIQKTLSLMETTRVLFSCTTLTHKYTPPQSDTAQHITTHKPHTHKHIHTAVRNRIHFTKSRNNAEWLILNGFGLWLVRFGW